MRYICQTTSWGGRNIDAIKRELPDLELVVDTGYRSAFKTFCYSLERTNDACVRLEDDAILCSGFREKVEKVIDSHPYSLINFFCLSPFLRFGGRSGMIKRRGEMFTYNVCTYYPEGYAGRILEYLKSERQSEEYDKEIGRWLAKNDLSFYQHVPNLVNHADLASLIDPRRPITRTDKKFKK